MNTYRLNTFQKLSALISAFSKCRIYFLFVWLVYFNSKVFLKWYTKMKKSTKLSIFEHATWNISSFGVRAGGFTPSADRILAPKIFSVIISLVWYSTCNFFYGFCSNTNTNLNPIEPLYLLDVILKSRLDISRQVIR